MNGKYECLGQSTPSESGLNAEKQDWHTQIGKKGEQLIETLPYHHQLRDYLCTLGLPVEMPHGLLAQKTAAEPLTPFASSINAGPGNRGVAHLNIPSIHYSGGGAQSIIIGSRVGEDWSF